MSNIGKEYPGYNSWPEIHGLKFITEDGGKLCCACANRKNGSLANVESAMPGPREDAQWRIIGAQWAEQHDCCDHCAVSIRNNMQFLVMWLMELDGYDNPRQAAERAQERQVDPETIATCFEVIDQDGHKHEVDLAEDEQ